MLRLRAAILAFALALAGASTAFALDHCPAASSAYDDRIAAIVKAPDCRAAHDIFIACAFGASGDRGLGDETRSFCEKAFVPALSPKARAAYDKAVRNCSARHARVDGTMQVSAIATCEAGVALKYYERQKRPPAAK